MLSKFTISRLRYVQSVCDLRPTTLCMRRPYMKDGCGCIISHCDGIDFEGDFTNHEQRALNLGLTIEEFDRIYWPSSWPRQFYKAFSSEPYENPSIVKARIQFFIDTDGTDDPTQLKQKEIHELGHRSLSNESLGSPELVEACIGQS